MRSLLCALALLLTAGTAAAQTRGMTAKPYTPDDTSASEANTQAIALAFQLATYGRDNSDADALLSAARILIATPYEEVNRTPATEGPPASGGAAATAVSLDPADLIAEARRLDPSVGSRADALGRQAAQRGQRGLAGGPSIGTYILPAYSTHTFNLRYVGGQNAHFAIQGDGDTDIDCTVTNEYGQTVGGNYDLSDTCHFDWYVPYTQTYTFRFDNLGGVWNRYVMDTN